jgi:TldD protein
VIDKLRRFLDAPADLVEIRASVSDNSFIVAKKSEVFDTVSGRNSVFSVRILDKGAFGFASTGDFSRLGDTLRRALKLARVSQERSLETKMSKEKAFRDKVAVKPEVSLKSVDLEQKTKDVLALNKSMLVDKKIVGYETVYADSFFKKYYLNSDGAEIVFSADASKMHFISYAKEKTLQTDYEGVGGLFGYEIVEKNQGAGEAVSKKALELLKAERVKSGVHDVVMGPKMTGVFSHEALGHACEADYVLTGESVLRGKVGTRLGSDLVTIYDDPSGNFNGSYPYDDEGVKAQKTMMVEKGVLRSYLHSRETAGKMKTHSTGNARAESVARFPIVRMSNVFFRAGEHSFDEVIDLKKGVYVDGFRGGQVDIASGSYQFASEIGYLIEDGELTKPVRDVVVFGDILSTMKGIDAVGKKCKWNCPGTCGKADQGVRVSDGGPDIRVRGVRVGGA